MIWFYSFPRKLFCWLVTSIWPPKGTEGLGFQIKIGDLKERGEDEWDRKWHEHMSLIEAQDPKGTGKNFTFELFAEKSFFQFI